jgi:organic hydroperoxide reductase OsmC/OhrA
MSEHKATVEWNLAEDGDFLKGRYSRAHQWTFDGGITVAASSAPSAVPVPYSNPANVDPEEAFVASLSSCHMLTFLWVAYKAGLEVTSYRDAAVGILTKNEAGVPWVSKVMLHPVIEYRGEKRPTVEEAQKLHDAAHHGCYISNSVKTEVLVVSPAA